MLIMLHTLTVVTESVSAVKIENEIHGFIEHSVIINYIKYRQSEMLVITNPKEGGKRTVFDIHEVSEVEATGSLWGSAISCACTWGGVYLLYLAACC